jgi:hypothetical protein
VAPLDSSAKPLKTPLLEPAANAAAPPPVQPNAAFSSAAADAATATAASNNAANLFATVDVFPAPTPGAASEPDLSSLTKAQRSEYYRKKSAAAPLPTKEKRPQQKKVAESAASMLTCRPVFSWFTIDEPAIMPLQDLSLGEEGGWPPGVMFPQRIKKLKNLGITTTGQLTMQALTMSCDLFVTQHGGRDGALFMDADLFYGFLHLRYALHHQ